MNPGQIALTRMPSGLSIPLRASAQVFTQLLVAEYDGQLLRGPYPAIDAVIRICLSPGSDFSLARFLKISIAGRTTFTDPPTFMSNVILTFFSVSSPVPTPALENTISTGDISSLFFIHVSTAAASLTSTVSAWTTAPYARQASATDWSRPALRPQRKSVSPRLAHSRARASPIPELAPVIRTVFDMMRLFYQRRPNQYKRLCAFWNIPTFPHLLYSFCPTVILIGFALFFCLIVAMLCINAATDLGNRAPLLIWPTASCGGCLELLLGLDPLRSCNASHA